MLKDDFKNISGRAQKNNATASGDKQVRKAKKQGLSLHVKVPDVLLKMQGNEEARDLTMMGSKIDDTESPKIVMEETRLNISWDFFF